MKASFGQNRFFAGLPFDLSVALFGLVHDAFAFGDHALALCHHRLALLHLVLTFVHQSLALFVALSQLRHTLTFSENLLS